MRKIKIDSLHHSNFDRVRCSCRFGEVEVISVRFF
jgi:hypothetical protein